MTCRPNALHALAAALAGGALLGPAVTQKPRAVGDSGEYFLMTEALFHHGRPDLRAEDLARLDEAVREGQVEGTFGAVRESLVADRKGRVRSLHFWAYPLACLPVKAVLHILGANELKALPITNALLLLIALLRSAFSPGREAPRRWLFPALLLLSPAAWFVQWPHPEVFSCALLTLSLVFRWEGHPVEAVLLAALASLQNPPLVLFAVFLFARDVREPRQRPLAALALLPALAPFVLSLLSFGRLSPLSASAASSEYLSLGKASELFFDLNLGLLPYVPVALLGALAVPIVCWKSPACVRSSLEAWAVLLAMAFACTATSNWNHGTAGPSRYGVWMLPLVLDTFLLPLAPSAGRGVPRIFLAAAALAVCAQAGLLVARGGLDPRPDYLEHSYAARFVLRHAPSLYNPTPEVFMERTRGEEGVAEGPVVYRVPDGCRKVLAQKRHWETVLALCGPPRRAPDFEELAAARRRGTWVYVDY